METNKENNALYSSLINMVNNLTHALNNIFPLPRTHSTQAPTYSLFSLSSPIRHKLQASANGLTINLKLNALYKENKELGVQLQDQHDKSAGCVVVAVHHCAGHEHSADDGHEGVQGAHESTLCGVP